MFVVPSAIDCQAF